MHFRVTLARSVKIAPSQRLKLRSHHALIGGPCPDVAFAYTLRRSDIADWCM